MATVAKVAPASTAASISARLVAPGAALNIPTKRATRSSRIWGVTDGIFLILIPVIPNGLPLRLISCDFFQPHCASWSTVKILDQLFVNT